METLFRAARRCKKGTEAIGFILKEKKIEIVWFA